MACPRRSMVALVAFVWPFSTMRFQMSPQIACMRGCKITLVALVWHFSSVRLQMSPQIAFLRGCKVTLVAFVWPFSTVYFQMSLQIACLRGCKVTLLAFAEIFSTVHILIVIVFKILLHHYRVGNKRGEECFTSACLLGTDCFKLSFGLKEKSKSEKSPKS